MRFSFDAQIPVGIDRLDKANASLLNFVAASRLASEVCAK
jgi:hypothetical protein